MYGSVEDVESFNFLKGHVEEELRRKQVCPLYEWHFRASHLLTAHVQIFCGSLQGHSGCLHLKACV